MAPTTTVASTTSTVAPTTAVAATTTITVVLTPEEAAAEVVSRFEAAWTECLRDLTRCDANAITNEFTTGNMREPFFQKLVSAQQAQNTYENLESQVSKVESATTDESGTEVIVIACRDDGAIKFDAIGNVVNDDYMSRRQEWTVRLVDGRWLLAGRTDLEVAAGEGNRLCAAN